LSTVGRLTRPPAGDEIDGVQHAGGGAERLRVRRVCGAADETEVGEVLEVDRLLLRLMTGSAMRWCDESSPAVNLA
jgi:hypothetical protein